MTSQDGVTPSGEVVPTPERGTVRGNRGRLHDGAGLIRRRWQVRRWLPYRREFVGTMR